MSKLLATFLILNTNQNLEELSHLSLALYYNSVPYCYCKLYKSDFGQLKVEGF